MIPNDIVASLQRRALGRRDQAGAGGHEVRDGLVGRHTGHTVIAACDNADQFSVRGAVLGNGNGRVSEPFF